MPDLYLVTTKMEFRKKIRAESEEEAHELAAEIPVGIMDIHDRQDSVGIIPCEHKKTSMVNEVCTSGDWCPKCGMLYP